MISPFILQTAKYPRFQTLNFQLVLDFQQRQQTSENNDKYGLNLLK